MVTYQLTNIVYIQLSSEHHKVLSLSCLAHITKEFGLIHQSQSDLEKKLVQFCALMFYVRLILICWLAGTGLLPSEEKMLILILFNVKRKQEITSWTQPLPVSLRFSVWLVCVHVVLACLYQDLIMWVIDCLTFHVVQGCRKNTVAPRDGSHCLFFCFTASCLSA